MRVLNLWQKNGVFKIEVIQPLLDMAAGSSSAAAACTDETGNLCFVCSFVHTHISVMLAFCKTSVCCIYIQAISPPSGSSPPPAKEPVSAVTVSSTVTPAAQLQNSDAFAAVAQLFQSSQGQQVGVCSIDWP